MPRTSRIVVPGVAHHVIQRGNRRQTLFFGDNDRRAYLHNLTESCVRHSVTCLAWCLMDNHIHLVLVPPSADALRAVLSSVHTSYSQRINRTQGLSGHVFEGRYKSYPMDDAHMLVAVRYVENNPVVAKMVGQAEDWPWSSARAHLGLTRDSLTDTSLLPSHVPNWRAMLQDGLESSEHDSRVETALLSGRPLAGESWLYEHGLTPHIAGKRGPKFRSSRRSDES